MTDTQAAYLAGLLDGEGCIGLYDRQYGGRPQLRLTITNTHGGVMDWVKDLCGCGSITTRHYVKPGQQHYQDAYIWVIFGQNAVEFLRQLMPYLIIKRDKALEAIASQEVQRVA